MDAAGIVVDRWILQELVDEKNHPVNRADFIVGAMIRLKEEKIPAELWKRMIPPEDKGSYSSNEQRLESRIKNFHHLESIQLEKDSAVLDGFLVWFLSDNTKRTIAETYQILKEFKLHHDDEVKKIVFSYSKIEKFLGALNLLKKIGLDSNEMRKMITLNDSYFRPSLSLENAKKIEAAFAILKKAGMEGDSAARDAVINKYDSAVYVAAEIVAKQAEAQNKRSPGAAPGF